MMKMMDLFRRCWIIPAVSMMIMACSSENPEGNAGGEPGTSPEELTVYLDFRAGWPFNEPCTEASAQTKEGETYTYTYEYTSGGEPQTMDLDFVISHGTVSTSIDYSYSNGALRFNSTGNINGLIQLPGIDRYYLNYVDARHISDASSRFAFRDYFLTSTEGSERLLESFAATGALTAFWMPVTEGLAEKQQPGQSYTLELRDKNMAVSEIRLVYTRTKPEGEPPVDVTGLHLFAHRGKWSKDGSDYFVPENSLTGIQMAALMGYEGIECDVRYTKDKVMVVMHDATINKSMRNRSDYSEIEGDVKVANLTFEQLRNNYVLESTEPAFRLPCPTLEEMLIECKRCGMTPMLHSSIYESYELAQEIMGDDWVCFTSANFENVLKVRSELNSNCTILWSISSGFDTVEQQLVQIGGDCGISSMESSYYTPEMISRLREAGYHVQCSIFTNGDERLAIKNGVDYVLTDRVIPEGARTDITAEEILDEYPPQSGVSGELPDNFMVTWNFAAGSWPFKEECKYASTAGETYTYTFSYESEGVQQSVDWNIRMGYRNYELTAAGLSNTEANSFIMSLPAVEGRYLTKITVSLASDSGDSRPALQSVWTNSSDGENCLLGPELKKGKTCTIDLYSDVVSFNGEFTNSTNKDFATSERPNFAPQAGKQFYLKLRDKGIISNITLTYSSAAPVLEILDK